MSPRDRWVWGMRTGVRQVRDAFLQALVIVIAISAHFFD